MFFEFLILIQDERRIFKNWTLPQNLSCFSLKIGEKSEYFFHKTYTSSYKNLKINHFCKKKFAQPLLSIKNFISHLIGCFF